MFCPNADMLSADSQIDGLMVNKYEGRIVRIGRVFKNIGKKA